MMHICIEEPARARREVPKITTAVILAGGKSSRMGRDKLSLPQDGTTVLMSAVQRFSKSFDRVLLSVDSPDRYSEIPAEHICDIYPDCGPLGGLHAALSALDTTCEHIFLTAADLPFSDPDAALRLIKACGSHEIAILRDECGRYEPLFGCYSLALVDRISNLLKSGIRAMTELYKISDTLILSFADLGIPCSSHMLSNMNWPDDYKTLLSGE